MIASAQYGTITIADGAISQAATITSVNTAKTIVRNLGSEASGGSDFFRLALTNSVTVTAFRAGTTGDSPPIGYEVIEFD